MRSSLRKTFVCVVTYSKYLYTRPAMTCSKQACVASLAENHAVSYCSMRKHMLGVPAVLVLIVRFNARDDDLLAASGALMVHFGFVRNLHASKT